MLPPLAIRLCRPTQSSMGERAIEMALRRLENRWRCPQQPLRILGCLDSRLEFSSKKPRLQLSNPVPALR